MGYWDTNQTTSFNGYDFTPSSQTIEGDGQVGDQNNQRYWTPPSEEQQALFRNLGYSGDFSPSTVGMGARERAEAGNNAQIIPEFVSWMQSNGYRPVEGGKNTTRLYSYADNNGKLLQGPGAIRSSTSSFMDLALPVMMAAGGPLSGAFGGGALGGAAAGGVLGGIGGGMTSVDNGEGFLKGAGKGALTGAAAGAAGSAFGTGANQYDLGGSFGLETTPGSWGAFANSAGNILGKSAITGKNPTGSLLASGANTAFSNLGSLFGDSPTTSFGNNMLDFDTGYDFGSNPMDMQGFPSLTTSGSEYNPNFSQQDFSTDSGSDWQDTLKKLGNNSVIKGLLGLGGAQQPGQPQQQGGGFGNSVIGGLAGMYLSNRQNKDAKSQISNLGSLFSQDSPYAQQLRQQLARKDAAAGRRSQYGTREVELQARLAELNSRNAPQLQSLYNQKSNNRNLMVNTLLNNKGLQGLFKQGVGAMNDYFNPNPGYVDGGSDYDAYDFAGTGG